MFLRRVFNKMAWESASIVIPAKAGIHKHDNGRGGATELCLGSVLPEFMDPGSAARPRDDRE